MKIKVVCGVRKSEIKGYTTAFVFADRETPWASLIKEEKFSANFKDTFVFQDGDTRLFFVGLGAFADFNLNKLAQATALFAKKCEELKKDKVNLMVPKTGFSDVDLGKTLVESINLSLYRFNKYKSEKSEYVINELNLYLDGFTESRTKSLNRGFEIGNAFSFSVNFARDLVNEPSSVTTPTCLAEEALKLEKNSKNIEVTVYDAKKMKKLGMDASLAIGKGSVEEPKFIKIEYKPRKSFNKVVLIGKGLTFDSGGLSIKTANSMETMKTDMAGAASVIAVFKVLEKLEIKINVIGLISAVENMPSGSSVKPGDVVRAFNGKTIEILNTDAEGRVTLADSLSYAASLKPKMIIDLATLTGACIVALGELISGVMGNDRRIVNQIIEAGHQENEKIWQLPLEEEYKEMLKSSVADIKNTAKRYGGAITAGLFLQEFVDQIPWAHLDIAGPAYFEKGTDLVPKGGSGIPVKSILRFLMNLD
jgi:leucyl aminopeptidase